MDGVHGAAGHWWPSWWGWLASAALAPLVRPGAQAPYRGLVGYFIAGLLCLPKLLGAGLLMMLAALALFLAPGRGVFHLQDRCWALAAGGGGARGRAGDGRADAGAVRPRPSSPPALWDGERVMHSLSITWHITRKYPFAAIGKIVGGMLLSAFFASMLFRPGITPASFTVGGLFPGRHGGDFGGGHGLWYATAWVATSNF